MNVEEIIKHQKGGYTFYIATTLAYFVPPCHLAEANNVACFKGFSVRVGESGRESVIHNSLKPFKVLYPNGNLLVGNSASNVCSARSRRPSLENV